MVQTQSLTPSQCCSIHGPLKETIQRSPGGKDQSRMIKEAYWQMLLQLTKDKGILVDHSAQSDWLALTCQGVLAESSDSDDDDEKQCPFIYVND